MSSLLFLLKDDPQPTDTSHGVHENLAPGMQGRIRAIGSPGFGAFTRQGITGGAGGKYSANRVPVVAAVCKRCCCVDGAFERRPMLSSVPAR